MPVILAALIRSAIQMAITLGLITAAQKLLDSAIAMVAKWFGATEEQAQDIVANKWLQFAEAVGIGAVAIKSKTPTVIAEKLGFTSKGFSTRNSIFAAKMAAEEAVATKAYTIQDRMATIAAAAPKIATKGKTTFEIVQGAAQMLIAALGIPVGIGLLITNTIDFGAWNSSAYQGTFQKILAIFGLEPDRDYVKSKVLSDDMYKKILAVFTEKGATTLKDPRTDTAIPFTRDNFTKIADFVAAQIIYEKGSVTTKELLASITALVVLKDGNTSSAGGVAPSTPAARGGISNVQVFTGMVAQGVLTDTVSFVARPDDMIESIYELQDAAQNNLAAYLVTLPSKVIYEIKIVSSITTSSGFKQIGSSRKVITGYGTDGKPRYKTVTNKFAVITLYVLTDKGTKSKLTTVVLGPTDAVKFQPTQQTLIDLEKNIKNNLFSTSLNAITATIAGQTVQPSASGATSDAATGASAAPGASLAQANNPPGGVINPEMIPGFTSIPGEPIMTGGSTSGDFVTQNFIWDHKPYSYTANYKKEMENMALRLQVVEELKVSLNGAMPEEGAITGTMLAHITEKKWKEAVSGIVTTMPIPGADAATLSDWYTANGKALPPLAERAALYEKLQLGSATLYVGTAEQNTKLLNALKTGSA